MSNAKRDGDNITSGNAASTWLAYNDTTGLPENVRVDPIFGALEIFVVATDGLPAPTAVNHAKFDGDNISTGNAATTITAWNDTTSLIEAMRCGSGGELLIIPQ